MRWPSKHTSPASGGKMPARQCSSVDLPEPLGPMTARISPAATDTLGPRRAGVWPNDLAISRASISGRSGRSRGLFMRHAPASASSPSRASVDVDPAQVGLEVEQAVVGEQRVDQRAGRA